ncbi:MAG: hypothetical protein CL676_06925 [Bdellovibrionaceae bacterium]|nr:hypothetical protein [Pseudobdellovibrionaceae bacterium]|tara:strand:- start:463 stop:894 length:432 start_codon:yes stop_codon:yes gene_type:complete
MKKYFLIFSVFLLLLPAYGEENEKTEKGRIGSGKAVTLSNEKEGFKLSEKAIRNLGISVKVVEGPVVTIPKTSLVRYLDFVAVYRLRDGWYRSVEVEPYFEGKNATFKSKEFKAGDQIVVRNSGLLRVVELDVFGPEADACVD